MWRCCNCGAENQSSAVCTVCGRPINEALRKINLKILELKFQGSVADQWMRWGARTGFFVGLVLAPILVGVPVILRLTSNPWQVMTVDVFVPIILALVLQAVILLPMLFGFLFLIYGSIIKPIWIALFCSAERFEQEYGSTKQ